MAGNAAVGLEQLVAACLFGGDGIALAAQITVEAGVGRKQRALKRRQRIENVLAFGPAAVKR